MKNFKFNLIKIIIIGSVLCIAPLQAHAVSEDEKHTQIILTFESEGPNALELGAHRLFFNKKKISEGLADHSDSIDELIRQFHLLSILSLSSVSRGDLTTADARKKEKQHWKKRNS